jgi:hypothetical protein
MEAILISAAEHLSPTTSADPPPSQVCDAQSRGKGHALGGGCRPRQAGGPAAPRSEARCPRCSTSPQRRRATDHRKTLRPHSRCSRLILGTDVQLDASRNLLRWRRERSPVGRYQGPRSGLLHEFRVIPMRSRPPSHEIVARSGVRSPPSPECGRRAPPMPQPPTFSQSDT